MSDAQWVRKGERGKSGWWEHPSGWSICHCGHPTAHHPWYLLSPKGEKVFSHNGYGFTFDNAKATVLSLLAGKMRLSHHPLLIAAVKRNPICAENSTVGHPPYTRSWTAQEFAGLDFSTATLKEGRLYIRVAGDTVQVSPSLYDPRPHHAVLTELGWEWQ